MSEQSRPINREKERRQIGSLKRDLLVLTYRHLLEEGLFQAAEALREELTWDVEDFTSCDNVDLMLILMEYYGHYQVNYFFFHSNLSHLPLLVLLGTVPQKTKVNEETTWK